MHFDVVDLKQEEGRDQGKGKWEGEVEKLWRFWLQRFLSIFYKTKKDLSARTTQISQTPWTRQAYEEH